MLFNSYLYLLLFLPLSLLGFALISKMGLRVGFAWLILASLAFYAWWNPEPAERWNPFYLVLILLSCTGNYFLGRAIDARAETPGGKKIMIFGISANLLLLGYYKYTVFFAEIARSLTGWPHEIPKIVLPLAISFFTFLQIAYLVDAYRRKAENHGFTDYLLFVTFFPHLIAGPLVHHKEMMPQFTKGRKGVLRYRDLSIGLTILILGLFKKVVIADPLATIASPLFDLAAGGERPLTLAEGWTAILSYSLQLYFDFSGYSDMAIGSARLFGIRFPLNFHSPYKAASVVDFWRRWHITLSRFLRDYLYFPLGGSRKGPVRRYTNLMLTMAIGGLWHGAGWTFLIWGFIHGGLLCMNHFWSGVRKRLDWPPLPKVFAIALTFLAVSLAWVFFRASTLGGAMEILGAAFGFAGESGWPNQAMAVVKKSKLAVPLICGAVIVWFLPNTQEFLGRYRPALGTSEFIGRPGRRKWWEWRPTPWFAAFTLILLYVTAREFDKVSEFIYFQF